MIAKVIAVSTMLIFSTVASALAVEYAWRDLNIRGQINKIINDGGKVYVQLVTPQKEKVWIITDRQKSFRRGSTVEFYPAYDVEEDVKVPGLEEAVKNLYFTSGVFKKTKNPHKYSFRSMNIGTKIEDVYDGLVNINQPVVRDRVEGGSRYNDILTIKDYKLHDLTVNVTITGDINGKMAGYCIAYDSITPMSGAESALDEIWTLYQIFSVKYGTPLRTDYLKTDKDGKKVSYLYYWEDGDDDIYTTIFEEETSDSIVITACTCSNFRNMQTYNYYAMVERKRIMKKIKDRVSSF